LAIPKLVPHEVKTVEQVMTANRIDILSVVMLIFGAGTVLTAALQVLLS
jgi:hypothetical protein